ncbi:BTB/POZ domain-containing protein [Rhizophagus irregularis DAOM 181602=DAOM 197198]|nr:BTB/POZ domain-containing protein [Rhizophagus irregularis DAOM 181602=DAOM 197198]
MEMSIKYSQELINDYEKLFKTDKGYDVIIYAGEDEVEIHAHSLILCTRSQYFRAAFSNEWANKKDGNFILNKPNISPQVLKIILRFIYCAKIDLTELQGPEILNLLIAVDELNVQTLIQCIREYLIKHQCDFLQQNAIEIFETAYQNEAFTDIWNYCFDKICEKPAVLLDKFINLKEPLLELLLKRDDLLLDEVVVWDNLIKWSFAQHPSIQQNVKKWNKEEITIMRRTLHKFIPLIRFYHITSEDFISKVDPFKALLPEDTIDNLLAFHMNSNKELNIDLHPPRMPKYDSIIINGSYFAILASWIEKKNHFYYNERNIPYNFNLLYRASRDGDTHADFHIKCDKKGATMVVIKITDSEQIVGGYNPLDWNSSNLWVSAKDSFLFSFTEKNNFQSAKVGYSNNNKYSIGYFSDHGVVFGTDLYFYEGIWHSQKYNTHSYPEIGIPRKIFEADDYEIFQVVKK